MRAMFYSSYNQKPKLRESEFFKKKKLGLKFLSPVVSKLRSEQSVKLQMVPRISWRDPERAELLEKSKFKVYRMSEVTNGPQCRVSMELLLRLLLLQLESIGPPKKEYFCKIKFQQLAFKKLSKILGSKSEMRSQKVKLRNSNPCQKAVWVPRHPLVPGYKNLSSRTFWVVQLPTLWVLVVQKIKIWNL